MISHSPGHGVNDVNTTLAKSFDQGGKGYEETFIGAFIDYIGNFTNECKKT